jgi:hypothetical protein
MNTLNIRGYSLLYCPILSILFASIPDAPLVPVYVDRSGGNVESGLEPYITVEWEEPLKKGGVSILGYLVSMSEDGGAWTLVYDGSVEPEITWFKF